MAQFTTTIQELSTRNHNQNSRINTTDHQAALSTPEPSLPLLSLLLCNHQKPSARMILTTFNNHQNSPTWSLSITKFTIAKNHHHHEPSSLPTLLSTSPTPPEASMASQHPTWLEADDPHPANLVSGSNSRTCMAKAAAHPRCWLRMAIHAQLPWWIYGESMIVHVIIILNPC